MCSHYFWFFSWLESQSSPSYKPSPLVAHVACMYHWRFLKLCRPSLSVISAAFIAFGKSWKTTHTHTIWKRSKNTTQSATHTAYLHSGNKSSKKIPLLQDVQIFPSKTMFPQQQLTPNNSNFQYLEVPTNLNQTRFPMVYCDWRGTCINSWFSRDVMTF